MNEILEEVLNYIKEIQKKLDVKALIFRGGASKNGAMIEKLQNTNNIYLSFVKSHNPEVAISLDSVHFSFNRNIISVRKAKYSIGIGIQDDWINEYEGKGKKIKQNDNFYCDNLFSKFITKNENIPYDKVIKNYYYMGCPTIIIYLYFTQLDNATFIDQKGEKGNLIVFKFGELILDVNEHYAPKNKEVIIEMKFGGTFYQFTQNIQKLKKKYI